MTVQTRTAGRHRADRSPLRHYRIIDGTQVRMLVDSPLDYCSQCGQRFNERACGPTHALIYAERNAL